MQSTVDIPIRFATNGFFDNSYNFLFIILMVIFVLLACSALLLFFKYRNLKNKAYLNVKNDHKNNFNNNNVKSKTRFNQHSILGMLIISIFLLAICMVSAVILLFSSKSIADEGGSVVSDEIVVKVDSASEISTYENGRITNNTNQNVKLEYLQTVKASGIQDVNSNCVITLKTGDNVLYNGGPTAAGHLFEPTQTIIIPANGGSIPLSATVQGLNKSEISEILNNKEPMVITATTSTVNDGATSSNTCVQDSNLNSYQNEIPSSLNEAQTSSSETLQKSTTYEDALHDMVIKVKQPSKDLIYNGQQQTLGYVYAYFYNSQGSKVPVAGNYYYSLNDGPFNESRFAEAINAGEYTIRYKVTAPGCKDAEGQFTNSIAKAENPMTFDINIDNVSKYQTDEEVSIPFPGTISGCSENLELGVVQLKNLDSEVEEISSSSEECCFRVENDGLNSYLICKANSPVDVYSLKLWAKSGGKNYEEKVIPDVQSKTYNFTWKVLTNIPPHSLNCNYEGKTSYFVPVFDEPSDIANVYFLNDQNQTIDEISNGNCPDMATMASYYRSEDAVKKPVKAIAPEGTKFYTTVDAPYSVAFDQDIKSSEAYNFKDDFVSSITIGKDNDDLINPESTDGPYFEDNTSWKPNQYNFESLVPTLNGVNYSNSSNDKSKFFGAYTDAGSKYDILSTKSNSPWGATRYNQYCAFSWYEELNEWGPLPWIVNEGNTIKGVVWSNEKSGVVVSLVFRSE